MKKFRPLFYCVSLETRGRNRQGKLRRSRRERDGMSSRVRCTPLMACTHGHTSSIHPSRQWLLRGDLVHMALRFDGPVVIHLSHGFNAWHTPHAFPWSVWSALFSCYELVESSLLCERDIQPRMGRWWAQRSSQTVVMASTDGQMSNDRRTPPRGPFLALSF